MNPNTFFASENGAGEGNNVVEEEEAEEGVEGEEPDEWDENSTKANSVSTSGENTSNTWLHPVKEEVIPKMENGPVVENGMGGGAKGKGKKKKVAGRIMWARQPKQLKFFPCRVCLLLCDTIFEIFILSYSWHNPMKFAILQVLLTLHLFISLARIQCM